MENQTASTAIDYEDIKAILKAMAGQAHALKYKLLIDSSKELLEIIPSLKVHVRRFRLEVSSVKEGVESQLFEEEKARTLIKTYLGGLKENVEEAVDSLAREKPSLDESLRTRINPNALLKFDSNKSSLLLQLKRKGVFMGSLPIIPISSPPLDASKLNRAGVLAESFGGYTVLKSQVVVGVNISFLKDNSPPEMLKNSKVKEFNLEEALEGFRSIVKQKYKSQRYSEVAKPMVWNGACWIWLATSAEVEVWKSCSINDMKSNHFLVKRWSFPF